MPDYQHLPLVDAQAMHRQHPQTFWVPPAEQLQAVKAGWFVKAGFKTNDPKIKVERMWVQVTEVTPEGFNGLLGNDPVVLDLKWLQPVHVGINNVLDVLNNEP